MRIHLMGSAALIVFLVLGVALWFPAGATNLTGTFKHPDGSPVNGKLVFLLSQPARLNDGSAQVVPMVKIFSVTNGQLEAGAFVYGNDVLLPTGTYYLVRLVDNNNNLLFEQKWSVQGTNLDLGTLTPTTTGVVVPDPLLKNTLSDQAVEGPVTFTSPITVFTLMLHGNLNPGSTESYDLGSPTMSWREVYADTFHAKGTPWFDVQAYGAKGDNATNDTAAFQAAVTACVNQGGGTVYVPMQTALAYRVPGPLTFTTPASGWCRMVIEGDVILADAAGANGNTWSIPSRWMLEGRVNKTYSHGTFMYDPVATIHGGTSGSYDLLTLTGGPAVIENLKVQAPPRHGINIAPTSAKSNFKIINVNSNKAGNLTAGSPLRIADAQWVIVRDSSFSQSGADTSPAIEITSTGSNISIFHFENVTTAGRTIKLTGTPSNLEAGSMIFENVIYENGKDEGMFTLDSKPGANGINWRGLSFLDCQAADWDTGLLPGGIALLKSAPTSADPSGSIEGVVVRNPAYFFQGIFKPDSTKGPQEIRGLVMEGIQNPSGTIPIGQFDQYWATLRSQVRQGTTYVDKMFKVLMPRPTGVTATPSASGGGLGDGTYYLVVTALDPDGNETYISDEKSATISGSGGSGKIDVSWTAVPGAVSYRIYGPSGTAGGGQATNYPTQNKPRYGTSTTSSFTYDAAMANSGNPPNFLTASPAAVFKVDAANSSISTPFRMASTIPTGTAPFLVSSTTEVTNLNAQRWHGKEALDFSGSLDFGSIAPQSCSELTIPVPGASTNSVVAPSWPGSLEAGLVGIMRASASGSVAVRLCNATTAAIDPVAQTFDGRVVQ